MNVNTQAQGLSGPVFVDVIRVYDGYVCHVRDDKTGNIVHRTDSHSDKTAAYASALQWADDHNADVV